MYSKLRSPRSVKAVSFPAPRLGAELLLEPIAINAIGIITPDITPGHGGVPTPGRDPEKKLKLAAIASNFNPKKVFWDRPRENLSAFREAKSIKDDEIASAPALVRAKLEVKFLGALAMSEIAGTCIGAPAIGVAFQEWFHNSYMGVVGTVVGDYFPAVFGFQAAWGIMNAGFYGSRAKTCLGRIWEFYKDVGPIHAAAALASIPAYAVGAALSSGLIRLINGLSEHLAEKAKLMPLVSEIINFGVVEGIYLSLLAGSTVLFVERIAKRYSAYLEMRFGGAGKPAIESGGESA